MLIRRHHGADRIRYQDAARIAQTQRPVLRGTPGTIVRRSRGPNQYWVRQYIRVDGAKDDEYIGSAAQVDAGAIDAWRERVEEARVLARSSGELRLAGFQRMDKKPGAVIGAIFNSGLFDAGLTLVGSHAFGVLLNELGVLVSAYRTRDLDLARGAPLALALPDGRDFLAVLNESQLRFVGVPGIPSNQPSTSYKLPGISDLLVDLLVPGRDDDVGRVVALPELHAHGQTIPFLPFLLENALRAVVLSPNGITPVTVPQPERFALHKLMSSERRDRQIGKGGKDLEQAAVLIAALEAEYPGRIVDAWRELPRAARPLVRAGAPRAERLLRETEPEAATLLAELARRWR